MQHKTVNLIWQTPPGAYSTFEYEYITDVLFKNFNQNKIFDFGKLETIRNNSIIIYSNNSSNICSNFKNYLIEFKNRKLKFCILHLSNENLNHNTEYYDIPNFVFRNYYDEKIKSDNVMYVPLGFKSGFLNKNLRYSNNKEYNFAFIGQPKSDRQEVLEILENSPNNFVHKTKQWDCATSLTQNKCKNIYNKTKFVPCPMGYVHPDSFRIMEVLESGSIPILKNYNNREWFTKIWGNSPLPFVENWKEIIKYQNISNEDYQKLEKNISEWYSNFKSTLSNKIFEKIRLIFTQDNNI